MYLNVLMDRDLYTQARYNGMKRTGRRHLIYRGRPEMSGILPGECLISEFYISSLIPMVISTGIPQTDTFSIRMT